MAKFCKKCGSRLDEISGRCPKCDMPEAVNRPLASRPPVNGQPTNRPPANGQPVNRSPVANRPPVNGQPANRPPVNSQPVNRSPVANRSPVNGRSANSHPVNGQPANRPSANRQQPEKYVKQQPPVQLTKKEQKKQDRKDKKKQKKAQMSIGQKIKRFFVKMIAIILALIIAICSCIFALVYFDKIDIPIIKNVFDNLGFNEQENDYDNLAHNLEELKEIDVGEELRNESQVLETIDVATSDQVASEADIVKQFKDKGFVNCVIYTAYSMDGTYNGDEKIDEKSSECHPLYYATYFSDDNYCWTVYSCNGEWSASPISYMYSGLTDSEIMVSEKNYILSYDSYTNCFYKMIPSTSECVIRTVSVINSETLDELSEKEFSTS